MNGMNIVDLLSILPFILTIIITNLEDFIIIGKAGEDQILLFFLGGKEGQFHFCCYNL